MAKTKKSDSKPAKHKKMWTRLEVVIAVLIFFEIIFSLASFYETKKNEVFCIEGGSCNDVVNSQYGTIFGIKVALFGVLAFAFLFVFFALRKHHHLLDKMFLAGSMMGSLFASYFLYLQFFVLHKICTNCLFVDGTMLVILALSIIAVVQDRKKK